MSSDAVTAGLGTEESHYLISKLINMTVNQATLAAQRQAAISELEGKMKQVRMAVWKMGWGVCRSELERETYRMVKRHE